MKMIGVGVVIFALVVSAAMTIGSTSAVGQFEQSYVPHRTMWVEKRANVRAGPSTNNLKVGLLEVGERVSVTGKIGDWFKLSRRAGQQRRFVYAPLLTDSKPAKSQAALSKSTVSDVQERTIDYGNGDRYRGPVRNGKLHGRGVFTWSDGHRYEGDFVDGQRTGQGIYMWPDGERYEGDFVDGQRTGQGVYTWPNGNRYEGDFVYGERTGRGVLMWPDGRRYEGDFVDGMRNGHGLYTWANGNRYEGRWRSGKQTGRGEFTFADGDSYTQNWRDGDYLGDAHRPESTCLRVERVPFGSWINTCDVGIDVAWSAEGGCIARYEGNKPCSWYIAPKAKRTAYVRGHVRWWECRSPGGFADVVAIEREGRHYCMGGLGDASKQRRREQRAMAEMALEAEERLVARDQQRRERLARERQEALEVERLRRLQESWETEDEEWRQHEERMAAERQRGRDAWQDLMDTINQDARDAYLETLQQLRNSSGPHCRPDVACARSDDTECMARMERYRGLPLC